jgi:ABC-type phosphate transport system substrate-binding protein
MIKLSRLLAGVAALGAAATLVAGTVTTASAAPKDPPGKTVPAYYDLVGVGSDTTEYVMDQITTLFNATVKVHNPAHPKFYSWDAVPPGVNKPGTYMITPKAGCKTMVRPNGSSSGITALNTSQVIKVGGKFYPCVNFARSSRARKATDPKAAPGGIEFVAFARDAISWAVRAKGNDAPKSLNLTQLKAIFTCKDTNWNQVGGKNAAIKVYLPQAGSGTLSTWETFMGITTLGSCVSQAPEENEGTYPGFNTPNAIFIYSIGAYIAQKYHSAACGAKPKAGQNAFGCNITGFLTPMDINGISPLSSAKVPVTNPKFPSNFWRVLYNVVPYNPGTANHMTLAVNAIFGHTGYLCTSKVAKQQISNYGFVNTGLCGSTS